MMNFHEMASQPHYRLETEQEIRNWVEELVNEAIEVRAKLDLIDKDAPGSAREMRRLNRRYLMKLGSAQGVIMLAHRLQKIPDAMAEELYGKSLATLLPTSQQTINVPIVKP